MNASRQSQILVIGLGNREHQDEGLGLALAADIRSQNLANVKVTSRAEMAPEDAARLTSQDLVIVVDASRNGASPFSFHAIPRRRRAVTPGIAVHSEEMTELISSLGHSQAQIYLLAIRGCEFEPLGGILSRPARANLAQASAYLKSMLHGLNWLRVEWPTAATAP